MSKEELTKYYNMLSKEELVEMIVDEQIKLEDAILEMETTISNSVTDLGNLTN